MPPECVRSKREVVPSRRARETARSSNIARPPPPRTKKKGSRIPEHIDLTSNDIPDVESTQQVSKKPPKLQESLPTKYTLSIDILIDDVQVYSRTILQTAGVFDYAEFISVEARKISEHCARIDRELKALSVEPEKRAIEPYKDESKDNTENNDDEVGKGHSSKKNTATNRRLAEARAASHDGTMMEIL
ncbi:MAG: hypothetical protein M1840_003375 [Geoglossum simile]|nr:MAG: hypothetical protein M1840_003375 [Geoglossum simile]